MHKDGVSAFDKYYVGINSLSELATDKDKVCVMNITGNESRGVTPTSHTYSRGNVVFGTAPGRSGQFLNTAIGKIPVYNNITEGLDAGHRFNVVVIYMPPSGVRDAVVEAIRNNKELNKIIILTEKISVKDARIIRSLGQMHGIDIFGANCLGLADAHNKIRIGGALGGSNPTESLLAGSVAIFSNSGNFTTTIAVYLTSQGWGSTTSVSSGKDIYIHFAAKEFIHAFNNDNRSKAAVMYIEPGGYYEHDMKPTKPVIACVVGRWKSKLTKAVGHAGSLAGSGDDALAKEGWFMDLFGVDALYTPSSPICSKKGAIVTNISYIPEAMTKVMALNNIKPDFSPTGNLSKKAWFGNNQKIKLPKELDMPIVEAVKPYNEQIEIVNKQIGAAFPRQSMKDTSGASRMSPNTQVTTIHNISILEAAKRPFEDNVLMSLVKEYPSLEEERSLINIVLNAFVNQYDRPELMAFDASLEAGNSPNTAISSAIAIVGKSRVTKAYKLVDKLISAFESKGLSDPFDYKSDMLSQLTISASDAGLIDKEDSTVSVMSQAIEKLDKVPIFYSLLKKIAKETGKYMSKGTILGIITTSLSWKSLINKKISRITVHNMPWYFRIYATIIGVSASNHTKDSIAGVSNKELISNYSFGETAFLAMAGKKPNEEELFSFSILMGLIISNGPGTISAQGAKGAVSADGPEDPYRIQINKAFIGFMTHTGFAHGGNGYEAISFLIGQFKTTNLKDAATKAHGINIKKLAKDYALSYKKYKKEQKELGNISYSKIPCINHPIFKDKKVNFDPREVFVRELFEKRGSYNIFLDFYHELVNALFENGISANVYCVNIDAVIAVILLGIFWVDFKDGKIAENTLERSAFTAFLYGRMLGCAAEIDDHTNRGRNMDTRTAASKCSFVN